MCCVLMCHEVRRAILDFNRKVGVNSKVKKAKIGAQLTKQGVTDLMDACCVFVYVQNEVLKQFGTQVMDQLREHWRAGCTMLNCLARWVRDVVLYAEVSACGEM